MTTPSQLEEDLIGLLMGTPERYFGIAEMLIPEHFTDPVLAAVYAAIAEVHSEGSSFSTSLVEARCRKNPKDITLSSYLSMLEAQAPEGVDEHTLAEGIIDKWFPRTFKDVLKKLNKLPDDPNIRGEEIVETATRMITSAFDNHVSEDIHSLDRLALDVWDDVASPDEGSQYGVETGIVFVDELLGPFLPGQLIVVGGATASGKSALVQQVAWSTAAAGHPVYLVTNEMSGKEVMHRIYSHLSGIDVTRLGRRGSLNQSEIEQLADARDKLKGWPLHIDGKEKATIATTRLRTMRLIRRYGIKLLILDHLQFIVPNDRRAPEYEQLNQITSDVKAMAKELEIPVILVSHISRSGSNQEVKVAADIRRPTLSNLHGSSAIEKAADSVLFVHRPEYYLRMNEAPHGSRHRDQWLEDIDKWSGKAEIIKAKHRQGVGYGVRKVRFNGPTTMFESLQSVNQDAFTL